MADTLFWLYLTNATLLIVHEIDSAYWKEWNLFWGLLRPSAPALPERPAAAGFVLLHLPLVFVVLWGLPEVARLTTAGVVLSLVLGGAGVFAFSIHTFFLRTGHDEFRSAASLLVLGATLVVSLAQLALTLAVVLQGGRS